MMMLLIPKHIMTVDVSASYTKWFSETMTKIRLEHRNVPTIDNTYISKWYPNNTIRFTFVVA